jgi:hypothetical protein
MRAPSLSLLMAIIPYSALQSNFMDIIFSTYYAIVSDTPWTGAGKVNLRENV